jgi:hypothetical protein
MRRWRGYGAVLVVGALAVGGVIAALVVTGGGHDTTPPAATTGAFAPLTVKRASIPTIAGGIAVDVEPLLVPKFFETALTFLPGKFRYRLTVSNVSNLGTIHSFQWYPPPKIHLVKVFGSSAGSCTLQGLKGFGGNQFPGLVLHQNVVCDRLDLKPPSCTCLGDGGAMTISFESDRQYLAGDVDLQVRAATLAFHRIRSR